MKRFLIFLLLLAFIKVNGQDSDEFRIGIYGINYQLNLHTTTKTNTEGYYTTWFGVLEEDGFNTISTYNPYAYNTNIGFTKYINLVKMHNMKLHSSNEVWYKPNEDNEEGTNQYNIDNSVDNPKYNMDYTFTNIYGNPDYSDYILGVDLGGEFSDTSHGYCFRNILPPSLNKIGVSPYGEHDDVSPLNLAEAIDHFQDLKESLGLEHIKVMFGLVSHGGFATGRSLGSSLYTEDEYVTMDCDPKADVIVEASYFGNTCFDWDENDGNDPVRYYLGKYMNIDLAQDYGYDVYSVICFAQQSEHQIYNVHFNPDNPNANNFWFKAYTSIIHGAKGILFYRLCDAYTDSAIDVNNQNYVEGSSSDKYERDYFPELYQDYIGYLARELRYLTDNGFLNTDVNSILYTKTDEADLNGILSASTEYLEEEISNTDLMDWHKMRYNTLDGVTTIPDESGTFTNTKRDERYGIRYTVRTNGDEVIMIASNPNPYSVHDIEFNFSNVTNPIMRNATSVDFLFSEDKFVNNDDYKHYREGVSKETFEIIQKREDVPITDGVLFLDFGPFDVHVIKFNSTPPNYDNSWENIWSNGSSNNISGWGISDGDKFIKGDFNGDGKENLMCIQTEGSTDHAATFNYNNERWNWVWGNYASDYIQSFEIRAANNFITGDFNGDEKDELLITQTEGSADWATLMQYNGTDWTWLWTNSGNDYISGFRIFPETQYKAGDFNGDGKDELLILQGSTNWAGIVSYSSGIFTRIWDNDADDKIGSFRNFADTRYEVGDFNGDGKDEVLILQNSTTYAGMVTYSSGGFSDIWSNGGSGTLNDWPINSYSEFVVGDYDNDGTEELLAMQLDGNDAAPVLLEFNSNSWDWEWSNKQNSYIDNLNLSEHDKDNSVYFSIKNKKEAPSNLLAINKYDNQSLANLYTYLPENIEIIGSTTGESDDWDVQGNDGADMGYLIYVPALAIVTATTCSDETDFETTLEIFNEDGSTTGIFDDDVDFSCSYDPYETSTVSTELEEGYYYIVVDGEDGATGDYKLTVDIVYLYEIPFWVDGSNTDESDDWDVKSSDGGDVSYLFYVPSTTNIKATTCDDATDYDTKLEIFNQDGTRVGDNAYNDDDYDCECSDLYSSVTISLDEGYYYAVVDGYGGNEGNYKLVVDYADNPQLKKGTEEDNESTKDLENSLGINIYPNPSTGFFNIEIPKDMYFDLEVFSTNGKLLKRITDARDSYSLDLSSFHKGLYILYIRNNENNIVKKLIVE